ncbi:DUF2971 domain-containing protein [Paenibacillus polygoni]|uniref:DUF2971 domain-containing protein n=1 Tax=Paenibacillus polygoni TaxID=3050112 RepID=A0ABY8X4Y9_9BACL|nr:DUF2971 domain-containing protein [Paenibacillus polygoni]WIV20239.1 DUF2971 domain-containing protein [Paenibacillus polygoni]
MSNLIYHYTGAEALKSIVLNQSFWITKSDYLNDTSEQIMIMDLLKGFFKEQKMDKNVQKYIMDQLSKYLNEYNHYILSFSKTDDSLPLWNYYSENEGYSIGIDKEEFIEQLRKYFKEIDCNSRVIITEVMYSNEVGDEKAVRDELLPFIHFNSDDINTKKDRFDQLALKLANMSYSIKHSAYSSEMEERIVIICEKNSEISKCEEFRVLRGSFIPYIIFNKDKRKDIEIPIKKVKLSPYHTMDVTEKSLFYLLKRKYPGLVERDISQSRIPSRY